MSSPLAPRQGPEFMMSVMAILPLQLEHTNLHVLLRMHKWNERAVSWMAKHTVELNGPKHIDLFIFWSPQLMLALNWTMNLKKYDRINIVWGLFSPQRCSKKNLAQINHELWAHSQPTIFHKNPSLSGGNGGTSAGSHDVTHLATRTMSKARGVFENKVPHSMIFHPTVKKIKWLFFCKKNLDVPH